MARSIQSPGVEIVEKDLSLSPILPAGTNIFMTGFAAKGPSDDILQITSMDEFEQVYGTPTNSAERYFYYGARGILNSSNGNLYVSRMPYGDGTGEGYGSTYGALVYPIVAVYEDTVAPQVGRNTQFIDAKYFRVPRVIDALSASPTLSASIATLSTNGINSYRKFTLSERTTIINAWNTYFTDDVSSNPTLSAFGLEQKNQDKYFVLGNNTVVTSDLTASDTCTYIIGAPKFFDLSLNQYQGVIDGSGFTSTNSKWTSRAAKASDINSSADFGRAGLIVVNKIQSTINNRWEGHYIGISDNTNLQPNTDHDSIRNIYTNGKESGPTGLTVNNMTVIPTTKLAFPLSASTDTGNNRNSNSISEALEKVSYAFPDMASSVFDDTVSFGLFKLRTSPYNPDAITLGYSFEESRVGSFDYYRQVNSQNGGIPNSFYIENMVSKSNSITTFINATINGKSTGSWLNQNGIPTKKVRILSKHSVNDLVSSNENNWVKYGYHLNDLTDILSYIDYADALFPAGSYANFSTTGKNLGSIPFKLDRTLRKIENEELFELDIVCENGLGTIYAAICANGTTYYDDIETNKGLLAGVAAICENEATTPVDTEGNVVDAWNVKENYNAVFQIFDNFVTNLRKDCIFIADPLRHIFVTGANNLTSADHNKAFSKYIYNPLRHLYEIANSSYSVVYGNWVKVNDQYAGMNIWIPFSPVAAADMANVDQNFEPWYAPAGFTRGRVTNALALAVAPKQKERDMLYKIAINPVAFFPNDGFNIFGQKTLLRQPSAFDRINVRRLFLWLEKATKKTVKYFVFEPNTLFTRNRVVSVLTPIFDRAKNTQGLYDYQIVCDSRNNPPSVIDQNEMVVDIYLKPVRSAEFILVNFYATSTSTNFNEIIGA